MSLKTKILVLKRIKAGDQDLLAKVYGQGGVFSLLVRDGFDTGNRFFGVFEPFNLVELDVKQRGDIALPNDVSEVVRLSFFSKDFDRFLWMSWVCGFVLKNVRFYEPKMFDMFVSYISSEPGRSTEVYKLRLKMDFLRLSGLKPRFLSKRSYPDQVAVKLADGSLQDKGDISVRGRTLGLLRTLYSGRAKVGSAPRKLLSEAHRLLDLFIEYHTK